MTVNLRIKVGLNDILAKHTGQTVAKIEEDTDREFFMGPQEAKDYGLVDEVVEVGDEAKDEAKKADKAKDTA